MVIQFVHNYPIQRWILTESVQGVFWIGSGLAILSALITFFFIPNIRPDSMHDEDIKVGQSRLKLLDGLRLFPVPRVPH